MPCRPPQYCGTLLLQSSRCPGLQAAGGSDEVVYKIDIPANRYDMLCLEGIARALNIFNDRMATPSFKLADMKGRAPVVDGFPGRGCCWLCSFQAFNL